MKTQLNRWIAPCMLMAMCASNLAAQDKQTTSDHDPVHGSDHDHELLEEVRVSATPLSRNLLEMSQSATGLSLVLHARA